MRAALACLLLTVLAGSTYVEAFGTCSGFTCSNLNKKKCYNKQVGCCVWNRKQKACLSWPDCKGLKMKSCKLDPTCLWSWAGNSNQWAIDQNAQGRRGSCVNMPAGFNKEDCQYNVKRGCSRLSYCKWKVNQNKKGGKCVMNGEPTPSPTAPTVQPTPAYTGSYSPNFDKALNAGSTGTKCSGSFFKENLASFADCDAICNPCSACQGYNYEITSYNSDGTPIVKCTWKKATTPLVDVSGSIFMIK